MYFVLVSKKKISGARDRERNKRNLDERLFIFTTKKQTEQKLFLNLRVVKILNCARGGRRKAKWEMQIFFFF